MERVVVAAIRQETTYSLAAKGKIEEEEDVIQRLKKLAEELKNTTFDQNTQKWTLKTRRKLR